MTWTRLALVSLAVGTLLAQPAAQTREAPPRRFKARVDMVNITATVMDADGRLVSGLTRDDFEIYEDGERQAITHFGSDRVPIAGSGSRMRARRSRISSSSSSAKTTSTS